MYARAVSHKPVGMVTAPVVITGVLSGRLRMSAIARVLNGWALRARLWRASAASVASGRASSSSGRTGGLGSGAVTCVWRAYAVACGSGGVITTLALPRVGLGSSTQVADPSGIRAYD